MFHMLKKVFQDEIDRENTRFARDILFDYPRCIRRIEKSMKDITRRYPDKDLFWPELRYKIFQSVFFAHVILKTDYFLRGKRFIIDNFNEFSTRTAVLSVANLAHLKINMCKNVMHSDALMFYSVAQGIIRYSKGLPDETTGDMPNAS